MKWCNACVRLHRVLTKLNLLLSNLHFIHAFLPTCICTNIILYKPVCRCRWMCICMSMHVYIHSYILQSSVLLQFGESDFVCRTDLCQRLKESDLYEHLSTTYGINGRCELDEVEKFQTTQGFPHDVMQYKVGLVPIFVEVKQ